MRMDRLSDLDIDKIISIIKEAGKRVLDVYNNNNLFVEYKGDSSPVTKADKLAQKYIKHCLTIFYPRIPIISEEDKCVPYIERKKWSCFWLIDPLDGTKEFVKKIPEFTINIALIYKNKPFLGIIYVPVSDELFFAKKGCGSYKIDATGNKRMLMIQKKAEDNKMIIAMSRSHKMEGLEDFMKNLYNRYQYIEYIYAGSSLKFCLIAEGKADIYPRLGPTMEWDTAAGQIIVEEAGGKVFYETKKCSLKYGKKVLVNKNFVVYSCYNG